MSVSESFDPIAEVYNRAYDISWNQTGKSSDAIRAGINAVVVWSRKQALLDAIRGLEYFANSQESSKHIQYLREMIAVEGSWDAL